LDNSFETGVGNGSVTVRGSLENSILPGPNIDFGLRFSASSSHVSVMGWRNAYPSLEITRTAGGVTEFLIKSPETNPLRLFDETEFIPVIGP
jgi:hypothetical protein